MNDTVAIKRALQHPGLRLKPKYLGPCKLLYLKIDDTFDVQETGFTEGSIITSICADYMKPWLKVT